MTKEKSEKKIEKIENVTEPIIKQKRGRKSKKDIQLANEQKLNQELLSNTETNIETMSLPPSDNITCSIQEITETTINKSIAPLLLENGLSSTIDIVILNAGISSRGSVVDTEIKTRRSRG